jgi:hypothetical protein
MAVNIINELGPVRDLVDAIRAMANQSIEQAFPDVDPPDWAITIHLLGKLALDELELLHGRLTIALVEQ